MTGKVAAVWVVDMVRGLERLSRRAGVMVLILMCWGSQAEESCCIEYW